MKKILICLIVVACVLFCCVVSAIFVLEYRTNEMMNDIGEVYENPKYQKVVSVENFEVIEQNISCGYAVIEMFSNWLGGDITEEKLFDEYGEVVTSTGEAFCKEMNKQFSDYKTTMYKYLSNLELIDKVYDSLSQGTPVPFEWSAKHNGDWTLHYSLIVGLDVADDKITVANPYGYIEELSLGEFLERTSFEAYEDMPFYFEIGFAFGVFEKNTIFVVE